MIVERSMSNPWLSNTYLLLDEQTRDAVMIDAGGPVQPLLEALSTGGYHLGHVLLTHHHGDHVQELPLVLDRHPDPEVLIHPADRDGLDPEIAARVTGELLPGETITAGGIELEAIHTPGHTAGMISLIANGTDLFTGDTLFQNSVGGVRGPGHTTYADLKESVMDKLLTFPPSTTIHPGHTGATTVGAELVGNPFVRLWRGLDPEGEEACTAFGDPATLVLFATDYDGGHKAWVRWPDGSDDIVPGSQVVRGVDAAGGDGSGGDGGSPGESA